MKKTKGVLVLVAVCAVLLLVLPMAGGAVDSNSAQQSGQVSTQSLPQSSSVQDTSSSSEAEQQSAPPAFAYAPQPQSAEEVQAAAQAHMEDPQQNPLPKWERPVEEEWVPAGFVQGEYVDAESGAVYYSLSVQTQPRRAARSAIVTQQQLQDALDTAAPGTVITLGADIEIGGAGDSIVWPYVNNVTLDGGSYSLTLAAGYTGRHLFADLGSNQSLTIKNITIVGANDANSIPQADQLAGRVVGGGLQMDGYSTSTFTLADVTIIDCHSSGNGGAVYLVGNGNVKMTDCNFFRNSAVSSGGVYNGNNCKLEATNCVFNNNSAGQGGALRPDYGELKLTNCELKNNSARSSGAIGCGSTNALGSITITGCTIQDNKAINGNGGAMEISVPSTAWNKATITIADTDFTGNTATGVGGAIWYSPSHNNNQESMVITGGSFTNNTGSNGGAIGFNGVPVWYNTNVYPWEPLGMTFRIDGTQFGGNVATSGSVYWDVNEPLGYEYTHGLYGDREDYTQLDTAKFYSSYIKTVGLSQDAANPSPDFNNAFNNNDLQYYPKFVLTVHPSGSSFNAGASAPTYQYEVMLNVGNEDTWGDVQAYLETVLNPRQGYMVSHWIIDGTNTLGVSGDTKLTADYRFHGPLYIRPVWALAGSVTYNSNNGNNDTYAQSPLAIGGSTALLGLPDVGNWAPQQANMVFAGWATTPQEQPGETLYKPGQNYSIQGDHVLYARWKAPTYTVKFDTGEGTPVAPITGVQHGSTISKPMDPERYPYTFLGWYTSTAYTTAWNFANDTVTSDMILYARWQKNDVPEPDSSQPTSTVPVSSSSVSSAPTSNSSGPVPERVTEPAASSASSVPTTISSGSPDDLDISTGQNPLVQWFRNGSAHWSLLNLISMLCGAVVGVFTVIGALRKHGEEKKRPGKLWRVLCTVGGICGIGLFFLTQNLRLPMGIADKWTPVMLALLLVQAGTAFAARYAAKNAETEESAEG